MGTFAGYKYNFKLVEQKKEEFIEIALKILNYGGVMQYEKVNLYGKKLQLLKPVEPDKKGEFYFHYNYFEDDAWENAGFDAEDCEFWSGKVGGFEFADVMEAVYVLEELYSSEVGYAEINGEPIYWPEYIAWINHLTGRDFVMESRYRLWEQYEKDCLWYLQENHGYTYEEVIGHDFLRYLIPQGYRKAMGGVELTDILYIKYGTQDLDNESLVKGSYPEAIQKCKKEMKSYLEENTKRRDEKINLIKELVQSNREIRSKTEDQLKEIAHYSLKMPARAIIYLMAEICEIEFWSIWKEIYNACYKDEDTGDYTPNELKEWRQNEIKRSVGKMRTADFLKQTGYFVFWHTPEELKGKPNYYLTDDDRLYWWDGSEEVIISDEMEAWLQKIGERHKKITEELAIENYDKEDFLREMMESLSDATKSYFYIFAFKSMFYEFLQNGSDKRYIAAIRLFKELCEENRDIGKIVQGIRDWEMTSKNVKCNEGRMIIKRYLAVLANVKLRKLYMDF